VAWHAEPDRAVQDLSHQRQPRGQPLEDEPLGILCTCLSWLVRVVLGPRLTHAIRVGPWCVDQLDQAELGHAIPSFRCKDRAGYFSFDAGLDAGFLN